MEEPVLAADKDALSVRRDLMILRHCYIATYRQSPLMCVKNFIIVSCEFFRFLSIVLW